ncbi:MAG: hypothetical protein KJ886_04215 [Candidatus Thermoplasmatota archaeon]|nr:hypothetical protein [Candidatus Thermoplasmatota archaeon]MCG2826246.1 hypothetical protein [Thermoplasmatales archaeon]
MEQKVSVWETKEGRRIRNGIILVAVIVPIGLILGFYGLPFTHGEPLEARGMRMMIIGSGIACVIVTAVYSWIKINNLKSSPLISVCCPYCSNTFQIPQQGKPSRGEIIIEKYVKAISFFKIPQQEKPFRIKCPNCGRESMLR